MNLPVTSFLSDRLYVSPWVFLRDIKVFIIDCFSVSVSLSIKLFFSFLRSDLSFNKLQSLPDEIFNGLGQLNIL